MKLNVNNDFTYITYIRIYVLLFYYIILYILLLFIVKLNCPQAFVTHKYPRLQDQ